MVGMYDIQFFEFFGGPLDGWTPQLPCGTVEIYYMAWCHGWTLNCNQHADFCHVYVPEQFDRMVHSRAPLLVAEHSSV